MNRRLKIIVVSLVLFGVLVAGMAWATYPRRHGARWDSVERVWQYKGIPGSSFAYTYDLANASEYRDEQRHFSFNYPKSWKLDQCASGTCASFYVERNTLLWPPERLPVFSLAVDDRPEAEYRGNRGSWERRFAAIEKKQTQFFGGVPWLIYDLPPVNKFSGELPYPEGVLEFGDWRLIVRGFRPEIFSTFRYGAPLPTVAQPSVKLAFTFEPLLNTTNLVVYSGRNHSVVIRRDDGTDERVVYTPKTSAVAPHGFTWSPDGKRLIFYEFKTDERGKKIFFVDLMQGKGYLVRPSGNFSNVAWSPTSGQIAFIEVTEIDARAGLYLGALHVVDMPIGDSLEGLSKITLPGVDTLPRVVQWIAEDIYYPSGGNLMKFNPQQQDISPVVVVAKKSVTAFAISAVKKKLAYTLNTGEVFFRDLTQTTVADQLVGDFPQDYVEELAFSPSGKFVIGYIGLGHYFYFRADMSHIAFEDFPLGYDPTWDFSSFDTVDEYDGKLLLTNGKKLFLYDVDTKIIENVDEQTKKLMFGVHN